MMISDLNMAWTGISSSMELVEKVASSAYAAS